MMWRVRLVIAVALAFTSATLPAASLDDFERSATKERHADRDYSSDDDDDDGGFFNSLLNSLLFSSASDDDDERTDAYALANEESGPAAQPSPPHAPGTIRLPWARLDYNRGRTTSDARLEDLRAELGAGFFGVMAQSTRLREHTPYDRLDFEQAIALVRISDPLGSIDFGAGSYRLSGDGHVSTTALHLGILVSPAEGWGGEYRWTSAHGDKLYLDDHQLTFRHSWQYASLHAGYRLFRSQDEKLHGPFFGVSVHY